MNEVRRLAVDISKRLLPRGRPLSSPYRKRAGSRAIANVLTPKPRWRVAKRKLLQG